MQKQLRIGLVGGHDGIGDKLEQGVDDVVTGEVDIGNLVATVNACGSHLLALVVGVVQKGRQMADERALEGAVEYGLLVVDKMRTQARSRALMTQER